MGSYANEAERRTGRLMSEIAYATVAEIIHGGVHEFIDATQTKLNGVGEAIFDTFFAIRPVEGVYARYMQVQRQS